MGRRHHPAAGAGGTVPLISANTSCFKSQQSLAPTSKKQVGCFGPASKCDPATSEACSATSGGISAGATATTPPKFARVFLDRPGTRDVNVASRKTRDRSRSSLPIMMFVDIGFQRAPSWQRGGADHVVGRAFQTALRSRMVGGSLRRPSTDLTRGRPDRPLQGGPGSRSSPL